MTHVMVYLWKHDPVSNYLVSWAESAIENQMRSQFNDFTIYAVHMKTATVPSSVLMDNTSDLALLDAFGSWVMNEHYDTPTRPDPRDVHILVMDGSPTTWSAGHMSGSVGSGLGSDYLGEEKPPAENEGAVGFVNTKSYEMGIALTGEGESMYKNTVMHELFHALTEENATYYHSPQDYCSSTNTHPDHTLGTIEEGSIDEVSPMATWYTPDAWNPQPCDRCYPHGNGDVESATHEFAYCATREADTHVSLQLD